VELLELVDALGVGANVRIEGGVAPAEVPGLIGWSTAVVNASDNADKVVFETMSCGRMPVYVNRTFDELCAGAPVPTRFDPADVRSLSERIAAMGALTAADRTTWGRELRRRIIAHHSLEHWAGEVARVVAEVTKRR